MKLFTETSRLRAGRTQQILKRKADIEKHQVRLQKVKDHLSAVDRAKKPFLAVNQVQGILGFCESLKKIGVVVPPSRIEKLEKLKAEKSAEYAAVDLCELADEDLTVSPFADPVHPDVSSSMGNEVSPGLDEFGSNRASMSADRADARVFKVRYPFCPRGFVFLNK